MTFDPSFQPELEAGTQVTLRLFGFFCNNDSLVLTEHPSSCNYIRGSTCRVMTKGEDGNTGVVEVEVPNLDVRSAQLYMCLKSCSSTTWAHQGSTPWVTLQIHKPWLPFWLMILVIITALIVAGLLNGLSIGLLSLDVTELKVIANSGLASEKRNARKILPLRRRGNLLLCSLLLGSTLADSTVTVLVDTLLASWATVLTSSFLIVLLVEILPAAILSRYGLLIGARTLWLTKAVVIVTFPISYPLSKVLDWILGQEVSSYTKDRIKALVKVTSDATHMQKQEMDIITGALELETKQACEIMTGIDDVYMLPLEGYLDFDTVADIVKSGYSRIPIYHEVRSNIVSVLFTKDLAILDPEDKTEIKILVEFYKRDCLFIHTEMTLDKVFKIFKEGNKGHMAFVYASERTSVDGKENYDVVGLLTLEDIFEEMIQAEIVDETDIIVDNRSKRKRDHNRPVCDYLSNFGEIFDDRNVKVPLELRVAALQFLSAGVKPFGSEHISIPVLRRMLQQNGVYHATSKGRKVKKTKIFPVESQGPEFIMVLEGLVQVLLVREDIRFEAGSFKYFGTAALTEEDPGTAPQYEYVVEAIGMVKYLSISRELYQAAKRATIYELNPDPNYDLSREHYPELFSMQNNDIE